MTALYEGRRDIDGADIVIPAPPNTTTSLAYVVPYEMIHDNIMLKGCDYDVFYSCGIRLKCSTSFIGFFLFL
jgi:hypothetical protein